MAQDDGNLNTMRLRIGMAIVAVLHPLFWLTRRGVDPNEGQVEWIRLATVIGAIALVLVTYTPVGQRFGKRIFLIGITLLMLSASTILVIQGWGTQYVIAPVILLFAIGAVAADTVEAVLIMFLGVSLPLSITLLHGSPAQGLPVNALVLLASAGIGGTVVSWFRNRSHVLLTQEIERREQVEADLRGAQAHLESILNATSDGILDVQFTADGPRISFANRRFGEIFELPTASLIGEKDSVVRTQAARSFRKPDEFERYVAWLYANPEAVRVDELEIIHPKPGLVERWSGPVRDRDGAVVGRVWAFRDVTRERATRRERDEHAARLETANAELERASRAKDLFLANLSHELRTPLAVIIGYLNLVIEGGLSPDECRDFLVRSNDSAIHLLRLISDMLDLTKLESGTAVIAVEPMAAAPVVEEVRSLTEVLATAKGLRMDVQVDPTLAVRADRQRVKQILLNLVGNALKFTTTGGVTITAAAEANLVAFLVRDTGCGIPSEQQSLLFGKFMRLDSRSTAPEDGVGLGLSICRELVTLMGGEITLTSAGLERGTEVRFTLPRAHATQRRAANP
ncbi:MAG: ATP-binding protein [Candidatus Binatia bacterium]